MMMKRYTEIHKWKWILSLAWEPEVAQYIQLNLSTVWLLSSPVKTHALTYINVKENSVYLQNRTYILSFFVPRRMQWLSVDLNGKCGQTFPHQFFSNPELLWKSKVYSNWKHRFHHERWGLLTTKPYPRGRSTVQIGPKILRLNLTLLLWWRM